SSGQGDARCERRLEGRSGPQGNQELPGYHRSHEGGCAVPRHGGLRRHAEHLCGTNLIWTQAVTILCDIQRVTSSGRCVFPADGLREQGRRAVAAAWLHLAAFVGLGTLERPRYADSI